MKLSEAANLGEAIKENCKNLVKKTPYFIIFEHIFYYLIIFYLSIDIFKLLKFSIFH